MAELPKIVRERLKAAPAEAHPDANLLTAFAERSLGERERAQVLAHLAACATCREVVALARSHEEEEAPVAAPRPARWWGLRWQTATALATVAVAALVLMIIPNSFFRTGRSTGPQVAQAPAEKTAATRAQAPATGESKAKQETQATATPAQVPAKKEAAAPAGGGAGKTAAVLADAQRRHEEEKDRLAKGLPAAPERRDQVSALAAPTPSPQPAPLDRNYELRRAEAPPSAAAPAAGQPAVGGFAGVTGMTQKTPAAAKAAPATGAQVQVTAQTPVPSTTETVEVSAAAIAVETLQWRTTAAGKVEHSSDAGQSWRTVNVAAGAVLNAVSAVGERVWAGGRRQRTAVLYYSADSGAHWTRLDFAPPAGAQAADVVALNFTDAQHGVMTVVAAEDSRLRQIWTTADGGRTWSAPAAR